MILLEKKGKREWKSEKNALVGIPWLICLAG